MSSVSATPVLRFHLILPHDNGLLAGWACRIAILLTLLLYWLHDVMGSAGRRAPRGDAASRGGSRARCARTRGGRGYLAREPCTPRARGTFRRCLYSESFVDQKPRQQVV